MDKAHELAKVVMDMSKVRRDGLVEFRMLDDYAEHIGLTVDETDDLMDSACDILVGKGILAMIDDDYYDIEQRTAWLDAMEDYEQAMIDEAQAYSHNIWR